MLCRIFRPESVQYFQFDSHGNMYIFAPGAGCSGEPKFVSPGDELIFNSSETVSDLSQTICDGVFEGNIANVVTCDKISTVLKLEEPIALR